MRSSEIRHVVRLRLTLIGPLPEIWRDVVIDRDLSLADLRGVIQAVFEGHTCGHHLFTDAVESPVWSQTRHRWGDRWTMIDLRDPTVIDEGTARIGHVLAGARPLFYAHTCEGGWLIEVEANEDDVIAASAPVVQVIGGKRRAPLACCHGSFEHSVLVGVLEDPDHPDREALVDRIQRTVGPWATFDPEEFDLAEAQRRLDLLSLDPGARASSPETRTRALSEYSGPLAPIVHRLPRAARPGLERHIAATGLDLPAFVTIEEAREATSEFSWLLTHAAIEGIGLIDGGPDPAFVRAGIDELGRDEEGVLRLVALAKRGRLLYSRAGRLVANKRSVAAAGRPGELWSLLARDLVRSVTPSLSGDLFLLSIADGSLADPAIGARRSAEALALLRDRYCKSSWDYPGASAVDCEEACDCPTDGSATWHDIVTLAIRRAATAGTGDARPVAAQFTGFEARELGFDPEWLEDPSTRRYAVTTRAGSERRFDETNLLDEVQDLVRLLSLFGLEHTDDGAWIVPPTLREFARESLRTNRGRSSSLAPF